MVMMFLGWGFSSWGYMVRILLVIVCLCEVTVCGGRDYEVEGRGCRYGGLHGDSGGGFNGYGDEVSKLMEQL